MKSMRLANEQETGEAYDQGKEAVIALFKKTFLELADMFFASENRLFAIFVKDPIEPSI
ncbi:MAG: hypothetical protein L6461_16425 [Anaerolineae bacterium]|nr:hypothetical protein [Anaerolineae bacterium]